MLFSSVKGDNMDLPQSYVEDKNEVRCMQFLLM